MKVFKSVIISFAAHQGETTAYCVELDSSIPVDFPKNLRSKNRICICDIYLDQTESDTPVYKVIQGSIRNRKGETI
jgi:hypothetical protein